MPRFERHSWSRFWLMPERFRRALLLAWFLLVLAAAPALCAAVRFDVFLGYDGIIPENSWFPVVCEVQNDGPGFVGEIEVTAGQFGQGQNRLLVVELPTGTTKRIVLPAFSANRWNNSWNVRLRDERGRIRAEVLNKQSRKQIAWQAPLVGALVRNATGVPVMPETADIEKMLQGKPRGNRNDLQPAVARLQPNLFPDNPLALGGLNVLYLNPEKAGSDQLKDPQVKALLAWLYGGGHLIVGVEQITDLTGNPWLNALLPADVTGITTSVDHAALQSWLGDLSFRPASPPKLITRPTPNNRPGRPIPPQPTPDTTVAPLTQLAGDDDFDKAGLLLATCRLRDGRVLIGSSTAPLAITARRGRGQVTLLTFSPEREPFLSWKNRPWFWAKLIDAPEQWLSGGENYGGNHNIDAVCGAMVDSKQIRKLPVGWLLLLLIGYLVVIGPLDQYWLKKINKQMLTWLTFPAYVALFSLLIYLIGYKLRAGESEWNELHVVDVTPHGSRADLRGWTFGSVYSPVNARYRFASDEAFASWRGEAQRNYGGNESGRAEVLQRGNNFQADISVPVWTSQLFVNDWWRQDDVPVKVTVSRNGNNGWNVSVENRLSFNLTRLKLVADGQVYELPGEVAPGETRKFSASVGAQGSLANFVQNHANNFESAVSSRQHAFGDNSSGQIQDVPSSAIAASFISKFGEQQTYRAFATPPGFDLGPLVKRGDAILLAWAPGQSLTQPLNRFTPRRSHRDTLIRIAIEINN